MRPAASLKMKPELSPQLDCQNCRKAAAKLTGGFLLQLFKRNWFLAAHRSPQTFAELPHVQFKLGNGAAESIAMHSQFPRCLALVPLVLLKNIHDEALLKFPHSFGIKNPAVVHLRDESFELVLHRSLTFNG